MAVDGAGQLWDRTGYGTLISTGSGDDGDLDGPLAELRGYRRVKNALRALGPVIALEGVEEPLLEVAQTWWRERERLP